MRSEPIEFTTAAGVVYTMEGPGEECPEPKPSVLDEALAIVNGARRNAYGHPENNFARIAGLWNAYLQGKPVCAMPITEIDVALLMVLMKVARLLESPTHRDSAVDIAGYAATLEMLWEGS